MAVELFLVEIFLFLTLTVLCIVQIQRLFFPHAFKALHCFATVPNYLQGLQSIRSVCVLVFVCALVVQESTFPVLKYVRAIHIRRWW